MRGPHPVRGAGPVRRREGSLASEAGRPGRMRFDAVIFDCDGVLVESEALSARVWAEMAAELGYPLSRETALRTFKGGRMAQCVTWLEARLGRPVPEGFVAEFRARSAERFEAELTPVAGIRAVLERLDVPYCVASNGPREKMDVSLRVSGLHEFFDARMVSAYEVGSFKPDPGLFLAAARVLGADPRRCAVVEDSLPGVRAGVAAEMRVFAYCPPEEFGRHAAEGATPFADMRELPALLAGTEEGGER